MKGLSDNTIVSRFSDRELKEAFARGLEYLLHERELVAEMVRDVAHQLKLHDGHSFMAVQDTLVESVELIAEELEKDVDV